MLQLAKDSPPTGEGGEAAPEMDAQLRRDAFVALLIGRRTEAVQHRAASGVERRWLDDLDAYHGKDEFNRPLGIVEVAGGGVPGDVGGPGKNGQQSVQRSTVYVQLTRQKTNTAAARVQEMLFPSDEANWAIKPTPVPQLIEALQEHGNTAYKDPQLGVLPHPDDPTGEKKLTIADLAAEKMRDAAKKCAAMEKQIQDRLVECGYTGHGRAVIQDAAMMGAGVIKGPAIINATKKSWAQHKDGTGSVQVLKFKEDKKPASFRVSPWDFFPDPACGEDVQDGSHTWERELISARKLRELARTAGYDVGAIRECLREGPQRVTATGSSFYEQQARTGDGTTPQALQAYRESRYELWTYVGEADHEDLEALGIDIPEEQRELASVSCVAVLCNDRLVKLVLNPMDTGDIPYDIFTWEKVSMSPWGVGIPYLMRYAQRTINAAWRALLDNMGASAGVQLIMDESVLPVDGSWQIVGRKIWRMPKGGDVDKAFKVFEIPSRQADLTNVIRLAMEFADAETALPQIAQGEQGSAPDTVGGMTLLMNAANTVLKRLARQFDDQVTKPHIRRYYDWEMQYNRDESIKGDFEVDARGSTSLVERDIRTQSLTEVIAAATHPVFGMFLDHKKLFRMYLESKKVTPDAVMKSDADIAQAQQAAAKAGPPKSPQEKVAEIRAMADVKKVEIDTASEAANEKARQEDAERERDHDMTIRLLDYRTKVLEYVQNRGISLAEFKNELSMFVIEKSFDREQAMLDRAAQQTEGAQDRAHDANKEAFRASQTQPAEA